MLTRVVSALLCLFLVLSVASDTARPGAKNSTAKKREKVDLGTKDFSGESQFTGDVAFSIPIVNKGGVDVSLRYNSNVHKLIPADNRFTSPGWVGLGWKLDLGSIQADNNNTRDKSDDKYFFVGSDATSELIVDTLDSFMMREFRHWKITREVSNGTVVGWTVIIEDGTKFRYGNYDKSTGQFSLDSLPTHATRSLVACGNLIQTTLAGGEYACLVPYQWDLSDIEDLNGDHTTIRYRQFKQVLSGTALLATSESYPIEIIERNGRKVEFVLFDNPLLHFDSPLVGVGQVRRETRSLKRVLTKTKQGSVVSGVEFQYDSMNVLDRGLQVNKKTFLKSILDLDGALDVVKTTSFEYAGVTAALDTGDHNPGALTKITLPEGGTISYRYSNQVVITDRGGRIAAGGTFWPSFGRGRLATDIEYWSMSGADFFVVWKAHYLTAYRWSPDNSFKIDGAFPLNAVCSEDGVSAYWVQNDYVVCKYGTNLVVAKRFGEGWRLSSIESNVSAASLEMLGLGADYFVYATECTYGNGVPELGTVKVATFSNTGNWVVQSLGQHYVCSPNRVICGNRFFASAGGAFAAHVYNDATGQWDNTGDSEQYTAAAAGPDYLVFKNDTPSGFYVKKWNGSSWMTSGVEPPYIFAWYGASLIPSNNFFLVLRTSPESYPWGLEVVTNTATGWTVQSSPTLLASARFDRYTKFAVGPDFFVVTWRELDQDLWKVAVCRYKNGQWQPGEIIASLPAGDMPDHWDEQLTPVVSGSTIFTELYATRRVLQVHSFTLRNEVWDKQELVSFLLGLWAVDNPIKPFMQPGSNFSVCLVDSSLHVDNDGTLFAWKRSYGTNFREVYCDTVPGGMAYPVASKTVSAGTGSTSTTQFDFSYGSFDEDIQTTRFNKTAVIPPGSNGKTVTYQYNDLGLGEVECFISNNDFRYLDGMPYRVVTSDKDHVDVGVVTNNWTLTLPGAYYEYQYMIPIETENPGNWTTFPGGALHTVIDDGATLDPSDFAYAQDGGDFFIVRITSPSGSIPDGSNLILSVDLCSSVPDEGTPVDLVLTDGEGGMYAVWDTTVWAPPNVGFTTYHLTIPSYLVDDPSRLFVSVEPFLNPIAVARVLCEYPVRKDRGVYYSRLTQSTSARDNVAIVTTDEFNETNGLIGKRTETNSLGTQRITETKYAYERESYANMGSLKHMYSQKYSTTVKNGPTDVESKEWTLWGNADGVWRPREEWRWKGDGSTNDLTAPDDPEGSNEALKVSSIALYDAHGNPRQATDASGTNTALLYGYDSTLVVASVTNSTASSVFATVFDDSVLAGWTSYYGTWGIQNGTYRQTDGSATGSWDSPSRNTLVQIDDAVLEADIRFDNAGNYRYVAIAKVIDGTSYLRFECRKSESLARIHAFAPGTNVYQNQAFTFAENRWYHLRGEIQGQVARFYIDGKKVVELTAAAVDRPAGYLGLCTFGTVASFDNIRFYPVGALATSQAFDPKSQTLTASEDENGVLQTTLYDPFHRTTKSLVRSEGKNVLASEFRYTYSKSLHGSYEKGRPNSVTTLLTSDSWGYSDMSSAEGWSQAGGSQYITFGHWLEAEPTLRMGGDGVNWNRVYHACPPLPFQMRVDFFADSSTGGTPHVLALETDDPDTRYCVQYLPDSDRFRMQVYEGGEWTYPLTFDLDAPPNKWFTIEMDATAQGELYVYVFPRGQDRILTSGFMFYTTVAYPEEYFPYAIAWSNDDFFYLGNFYCGILDRQTTFFEGLGRELQAQRQLGNLTVVASTTEYDSAGRAYRFYKPYEKDYTGVGRHRFDSLYATNANTYYNDMDNYDAHTSGYPYSETAFRPDPLARVWKQAAPGSDWRIGSGHEVQTAYTSNGSGDVPGYSSNTLFKSVTLDEDGTNTWLLADKFGNTVASVVDPPGLNLLTRMQYDVLGNRTSSITPRGDTTKYDYTPLGELRQKTSPDQGASEFIYDKNGNLRFVKDAAHTGTTANNVNLSWSDIEAPYSVSGQFTLTMPGKVNLNAYVWDIGDNVYLSVRIKANGTVIRAVQTFWFQSGSGSIILPKGTYTYELQTTGEYGYYGASIICTSGYEFTYYKYDVLSRPVEFGEYESNSVSANFTQANAENGTFPSASTILTTSFVYDTESSDAHATGQRNLKGRVSMAKAYRLGSLELTSSYSYDHLGKVEWVVQTSATGRWWQLKYEYDVQGRVTKKSFFDGYSSSYNLFTFNEYDQMGRLSKVHTGPNADGSNWTQEAAYTYYAGSTTKRQQLASVQGVDYRYNTRDWLTQINEQNLAAAQDPGHDGPGGSGVAYCDKFGMILGYQYQGHIGYYQNAIPHWNGNISWIMYIMSGVTIDQGSPYLPTALVGNTYSYDKANRILGSDFGFYSLNQSTSQWSWYGTSMYDEIGYQYDGSGNITAVQRYGNTGSLMDNLTYTYATGMNRLRHVSDGVAAGTFSSDIDNQLTDNYGYDANGSLERDLQRDVSFAVNDTRNLPVSVWKASTGQELKYYYDTQGKRIRKDGGPTEYYLYGPGGETEVVVRGDENGATHSILGRDDLGQVKRTGASFSRYYYLKDHLGTIKMTVDASCNTIGYDDYYPFGQQMDGRCNTSSADARYKFTGKERDVESQYDYFGARYYDARICRWLGTDPKSYWYPSVSPYVYALSNPLAYKDPNGLWTDPVNNATYRVWYGTSWAPEKSKFGKGVREGGSRSHQGVDLDAKSGTEVRAVEKGKIAKVWDGTDFGKSVMLEFKDAKGNTLYAQYSHLSAASVKEGQEIKEGDAIGKSGTTGNAKDLSEKEQHLHFGISTTKDAQQGIDTYKNPTDYMTITTPEKPAEETKAKPKAESKPPEKKK